MEVSIYVEGQDGLTWPHWKSLAAYVDTLGFTGLYRSDHFTNTNPPDKDSLELIVSLAFLAQASQRIVFGPLVAPMSIRHPALLIRQAIALSDLSNGRLILGVGAGWQPREHHAFGFELGDVQMSFQRLEEGLEVVTRLLQSNEPVYYEGKYFQLRGAALQPKPLSQGGLPILIGGNGIRRTLPLVARFGNIWNGLFLSPNAFHERSILLNQLLARYNRQCYSVKRTLLCQMHFAPTPAELDRRLSWREQVPVLAGKTLDQAIEILRSESWGSRLVGTPDMIVEQLKEYDQAGVEELIVVWAEPHDIVSLCAFARCVFSQDFICKV